MPSPQKTDHESFSQAEVREVLHRIEERNVRLKEVGFDFRAAVAGILDVALPLPEPILEIATGKGRFLSMLAQHVKNIVTVDSDPAEQRIAKILAHAQGVGKHIQFFQGDAAKLPFPDHAFSAIVSMNTFHHLQEPFAVLREMARLVKPDGKVVISDFDEDGYAAMERLHAEEGRVHPRSKVGMEEIERFWRLLGWEVQLASAPCQQIVVAYGQKSKL